MSDDNAATLNSDSFSVKTQYSKPNLGLYLDNDPNLTEAIRELDTYFYMNPLTIQSNILQMIKNSTEGKRYVADINSSWMTLLEMLSEITAGFSTDILNKFNLLYSSRTTTMEDLWDHISDFEYVGLYSTPSSCMMKLVLDKDYIIAKATEYNSIYNLIRIPGSSVFNLDGIPCSIYYPIDIRINKITNNINVVYNTDIFNPLMSINDVSLTKREYTVGLVNFIEITFPIWQFQKESYIFNSTKARGFRKEIPYSNKFYALRMSTYINGNWKELKYSFSDFNYNVHEPTVIIKIAEENQRLLLEIPLIYFSRDQVGTQFKIDVFTTYGDFTYNLTNLDLQKVLVDFDIQNLSPTEIQYSSLLKNIPTIIFVPDSTTMTGGSDAKTFNVVKDTVISDSKEVVPISHIDLSNYFKKNGYNFTLLNDSVTNRTILASRHVKLNNSDTPVDVFNGTLVIEPDQLLDELGSPISEHIFLHNDRIVLTSEVMYQLTTESNKLRPVDKDTLTDIASMDALGLMNFFNLHSSEYFSYPYCLVLNISDRYPLATSYDLFETNFSGIQFKFENKYLASTMDVITGKVTYLPENHRYMIDIGFQVTGEISNVNPTNIKAFLRGTDYINTKFFLEGVYQPQTEPDDLIHFTFVISTEYDFHDDQIVITNATEYSSDGSYLEKRIDLIQNFDIVTFIPDTALGVNVNDVGDVNFDSYLPLYISGRNSYVGLTNYQAKISLGERLSSVLDNSLTVNWTEQEYEKYEYDVPATYSSNIYERDVDGKIVYTVDSDGNVIPSILHNQGDIILDDEGNTIYAHKEEDLKLDVHGLPIPLNVIKSKYFVINVFMISYLYKLINTTTNNITQNIRNILQGYYSDITLMKRNLLENIDVFFKPFTSIGYIEVDTNLNEGIKQLNLQLWFRFKFFVTTEVYNNVPLQDTIIAETIEIVNDIINNESVLSLSVIIERLYSVFKNYCYSVEIKGFNDTGDTDSPITTIIKKDPNKKFTIRSKIVYDSTLQKFHLEPDLNIDFRMVT